MNRMAWDSQDVVVPQSFAIHESFLFNSLMASFNHSITLSFYHSILQCI